tara:strand:+ start:263 stop:868 length:606 start_codon:yes stop_codon:yes gene_type:complete
MNTNQNVGVADSTFSGLIMNAKGVNSNVHPNTYRIRFNKILKNFLCEDTTSSNNRWALSSENKNEYLTRCSTTLHDQLIQKKGQFENISMNSDSKPEIVEKIEREIDNLVKLRQELLGAGASSGQLAIQAKSLYSDDLKLSNSQKNLLKKLDEVQKFKKDYAGDVKDVTYIGKSKKQLELAYYIGGIGVMLLFILKGINYK